MPIADRRNAPQRLVNFAKIKETLEKNWLLWTGPTIAFTFIGMVHAVFKQNQWKASQAMIVRDEAIGELGMGPIGRFDSNDSLKRSLETILQIAKHREVVVAALNQAGPPKKTRRKWPTESMVESLQDEITVSAPKGTEFGTSDLVYLSVTSTKPGRAVALTSAVCDQLEKRMQGLRNQFAQSIIAELSQKQKLAERDLQLATTELSKIEKALGSDLGEMRTLAEAGSAGESNVRSQLNQIKIELRQADTIRETQAELLSLLQEVGTDAATLVATPNQLLEAHPSLRRLKEGLVDAQLRTARLKGSMTDDHPSVRAALLNERNVQRQLQQEAKNAIREIQAELSVSQKLINSLQAKMLDVRSRLDQMAGHRATYVNLVASVDQRREQLRQVTVALADARGRQEAASASSLITRLDDPVTGSRPLGPGRLTLVVLSSLTGLLLGLSIVYLVAPWQQSRRSGGRRGSDARGRRTSDRSGGGGVERRTPPAASPVPQLIDARPLEFQTLPEAFTLLPARATRETSVSLEHLARIVDSRY